MLARIVLQGFAYWFLCIAAFAAYVHTPLFGDDLFHPGRIRGVLIIYVLPLALLAAILFVTRWAMMRCRRPMASDAHCSHCRYNLTGNVSGVCPECGTPARAV